MALSWELALGLLDTGDVDGASRLIDEALRVAPHEAGALFARGRLLFMLERYSEAAASFEDALRADPANIEIAFARALAVRSLETLRARAEARDLLVELAGRAPDNARIVRAAAESTQSRGPLELSLELWGRLITLTPEADAYRGLSETLARLDRREEALEALRTAAALDPERYAAELAEADVGRDAARAAQARTPAKRARYPNMAAIKDDLKGAIVRHVMGDLNGRQFITRATSFFSMGSCFAMNLTRALQELGYTALAMPLTEEINTTYANRYFVDWLEDAIEDPALAERISSLVADQYSKRSGAEMLRSADALILTLGVGAAFFDRHTGAFVMPRPSTLTTRTLAEEYQFRTTTVAENVANVSYVIDYVRKINPEMKVVLTVSPVPMHMTFEFASAVVADCISKSTMRVAAHELLQRYEGAPWLYYFPSFEVFRWLGSHMERSVFEDGAAWHVAEDIVQAVVESFVELLSVPGEDGGAGRIRLTPLAAPSMIDRARPVYFYGSGLLGQGLVEVMGERGSWNFGGFIDSYQAGSCLGYPVLDLTQFRAAYRPGDQVVITSKFVGDMARKLQELDVREAYDANAWWRWKTNDILPDLRAKERDRV